MGKHWEKVIYGIEKFVGFLAMRVDNAKALLHANSWDVYVNEKENLFKGGYLVEFVVHDNNKILWEVFDNHIVEEPTDHKEIGLRRFDLKLFYKDEEEVVREGYSEFPCLLVVIKI